MTTQLVKQNFSAANGIIDASGYRIFSEGDIGQAHAIAHELFDQGLPQQGHHLLGQWLDANRSQGSNWARSTATSSTLRRFGHVCEALTQSAYRQARDLLWPLLPELSQLGGSHAQNGIFRQLASWAGQQADTQTLYLNAA